MNLMAYAVFFGFGATNGQWRPDGRKTNNEVSQAGSDDSGVGPVICPKHLTFACSCCQPDWKEDQLYDRIPRFIKEIVKMTPQPSFANHQTATCNIKRDKLVIMATTTKGRSITKEM